MRIIIEPQGALTFIDEDRLAGLVQQAATIKTDRASHVERGRPELDEDPRRWYADLSPVDGPVLGGFELRHQALDAERRWLESNHLGGSRT